MKANKIISTINFLKKDKVFFVLLLTLILSGLLAVIDIFLQIQPSKTQTWYRFVPFSSDDYRRTNWYYAYNWALFVILSVTLNIALAAKLLKSNYREATALVLAVGIIIVIIASVNFNLILELPK